MKDGRQTKEGRTTTEPPFLAPRPSKIHYKYIKITQYSSDVHMIIFRQRCIRYNQKDILEETVVLQQPEPQILFPVYHSFKINNIYSWFSHGFTKHDKFWRKMLWKQGQHQRNEKGNLDLCLFMCSKNILQHCPTHQRALLSNWPKMTQWSQWQDN